MRLYLARHGEALNEAEDPKRGLSPMGLQKIDTMGRFLSNGEFNIKHVYHSGKTRAEQTAKILASHLAPEVSIEQRDGLNPNDPIENAIKMIESFQEDTLVVGHLPYMADLAARLTQGAFFQFQAGNLLCLEGNQGVWSVVWFFDPALCQ